MSQSYQKVEILSGMPQYTGSDQFVWVNAVMKDYTYVPVFFKLAGVILGDNVLKFLHLLPKINFKTVI